MTDNEKTLLIEADQRSKSNQQRIIKLEEKTNLVQQIAVSVEVMANEMKNLVLQMSDMKCGIGTMKNDYLTMKEEVTKIKHQDSINKAKKWDEIKDKVVWLFIGGIGTYFVSQLISNILSK